MGRTAEAEAENRRGGEQGRRRRERRTEDEGGAPSSGAWGTATSLRRARDPSSLGVLELYLQGAESRRHLPKLADGETEATAEATLGMAQGILQTSFPACMYG